MNDELYRLGTDPIKLIITEDEFAHCVAEVTTTNTIKELIKIDPVVLLEITAIGMELWQILEKRARMQIVANTILNNGKEDK